MLTPKQNGTVDGVDPDCKKASSASIKGMWKKAFKTLKSTEEKTEKDKDKERDRDKDKGKGGSLIKRASFTKLRKDSNEKDKDGVEFEPDIPIDPVYSLLKCAADLPKGGTAKTCTTPGSKDCTGHKHDGGGNTSQSSSPSSSGMHDLVAQSLGGEFKYFYKMTSPTKKKCSAFDQIF